MESNYPDYRLPISFDSRLAQEAYDFLNFIKAVGVKHDLVVRYRTYKSGRVVVIVPKTDVTKFDTTLQELIMMRGLYYYAMSLKSRRTQIIEGVIAPIYEWLIEGRFENSNSKYIRQHILAEINPSEYIPGDYRNEFSNQYQILYRRWVLGVIKDNEFILELDSLMTKFLLIQINHEPGARSQQFNQLLAQANVVGIGMHKSFRKIFEKIHHTRKQGLHQLNDSLAHKEITELGLRLMTYFQYYDEFSYAQECPYEKLNGIQYARICYGDEDWRDEKGESYKDKDGKPYDFSALASRPCGDCAAVKGQLHAFGCDIEQCPRCKGQFLSCECIIDEDIDE